MASASNPVEAKKGAAGSPAAPNGLIVLASGYWSQEGTGPSTEACVVTGPCTLVT